jgi:hypothetical protein
MKCCPLLVTLPGNQPFTLSLLWPIKDIEPNELITRNFLPGVQVSRNLRLCGFLANADFSRPKILSVVKKVCTTVASIPLQGTDEMYNPRLFLYI